MAAPKTYFFAAGEALPAAGAPVLSLLAGAFFTDFLWFFFEPVLAVLVEFEVALCACAPAGGFACAAKVNGTAAAVRAIARIVFFIVFFSPSGPFLSPAHNPMLRETAVFLDSLRRLT